MADLDLWQQPNGFPTLDYFRAVAEALEAAGITLEGWHNDEGCDAAFTVDRKLIDPDPDPVAPQRGAFLGWRCGEYDDPQHADDFTGAGWFWCPCTDADKHGDYVCSLGLPYLAEPAQVAGAFAAALTADYGLTLTPATTRPDTCPVCQLDLRGEGYPLAHQRDPDGRICEFGWSERQQESDQADA